MILCIDTATQTPGVTLVQDVKAATAFLEFGHVADTLLLKVDELLKATSATVKDLSGIMVLVGPGSFTGLRVGIAVANQFAHQLSLPIVGLKTDEFWMFRTSEKNALFLQSMNRDEVYTPHGIKTIKEIAAMKDQKWLGELTSAHREELHELQEITDIKAYDETWVIVATHFKDIFTQKQVSKYTLPEPYYAKAPTITAARKPFV